MPLLGLLRVDCILRLNSQSEAANRNQFIPTKSSRQAKNGGRPLPGRPPFFAHRLHPQYFRYTPFCFEKYAARSFMSASDRACTCPAMMGFLRLPDW